MWQADLRTIRETVLNIDAKLDTKAGASDLAEVKGKVGNLPTTIQILGFVVAIFVAAGAFRFFAA